MRTKDIALIGITSAVMIVLQVALRFLPNIEFVSLLVILYTLIIGWKTLYIIYVFVFVQGLIYGFHLWWISYLYVWTILFFIVMLLRKNRSSYFWTFISGIYGLAFGALCSIPYLFIGGFPMALANWVSGIPFDIVHCIGNFIVALIFFKPLYELFTYIMSRWY